MLMTDYIVGTGDHYAGRSMNGSGPEEATGDIQVVARVAQLLRLVTPQQPVLKVPDVVRSVGLGRTTVVRYLNSLANVGILERREDGGYVLGPLQQQLGALALHGTRVLDLADPELSDLAADAGVTAVLSVWGGHGPVVVRCIEPPDAITAISVRVGGTLTIDSAQALVFQAFLPERDYHQRLLSQLPSDQQRALQSQIDQVRADGFVSNQQVAQGLVANAVPIMDSRSSIVASIALVGTVHALSENPRTGQSRALMLTARRLSEALGYRGEMPFATLTEIPH